MKLGKSFLNNLVIITAAITAASCTDDFSAEYADPTGVEIVDDRWNETDARKTSEILINSMISKPWLENFRSQNKGERPLLIVDNIENRTDEHIDTKAIGEAIRDEVLNSGRVRFVNAKARDKILKEIKYQNQSGMVAKNTAAKKGRQLGADFFLTGAISSQVHSQGGKKTVTYQTVMELTDLETAELVWSQKYHVKKRFKKSSAGW